MPARFREVAPGLLRGGAPSPNDLAILKNVWGVKRIVSLDGKVGEQIAPFCQKLGLEQIIFPIENTPDIKDNLKYLKDNIGDILTENMPVYVHCFHGKDRTGFAVAAYRLNSGWDYDHALKEALDLDFGTGLSQKHKNLYTSILKDENDADDIVSKVRDSMNDGTAISNTDSRHSLSPITPIPDELSADDRRRRRHKIRKMLLEDLNDAMAQVGVYENCNPILRGLGPIEPCGVLPCGNLYL